MKTRNDLKICNFRKEIGIKGEKTIQTSWESNSMEIRRLKIQLKGCYNYIEWK